MAHFAELDDSNVVIRVIVIDNNETKNANGVEKENIGAAYCEKHFGGRWVQTSYNGKFRKRYAGSGFTYDAERDAFIPPKVYNSWVLDEETLEWAPPIPQPEDANLLDMTKPTKIYDWNEATTSWVLTTEISVEQREADLEEYRRNQNN